MIIIKGKSFARVVQFQLFLLVKYRWKGVRKVWNNHFVSLCGGSWIRPKMIIVKVGGVLARNLQNSWPMGSVIKYVRRSGVF